MRNVSSIIIGMAVFTFTVISCDNSDDISESLQSQNKNAGQTTANKSQNCTNIQSGEIVDFKGETITIGFNDEGYNYQAKIYSGEMYPETSPGWYLEWRWNDAYLSTQDCDGDNLLDFANGQDNYRDTGAWTTTKWTKTYTDQQGNQCRVSQFTKFIAVPVGAYVDGDLYYDADGNEIGEVVPFEGFEDFARVQLIWNDPCQGINGVDYKTPGPVGLGNR